MSSIVIIDDGSGIVDSDYLAQFLADNDHEVQIEYDVFDAILLLARNGGGLAILSSSYQDLRISSWKMAVEQIQQRATQARIIVVSVSRNPGGRLAEEVKQKGALGPVADINSHFGREELQRIIDRLTNRPQAVSKQKRN